eukprot:363728-Pelagomonas_calceolata.AAC.1
MEGEGDRGAEHASHVLPFVVFGTGCRCLWTAIVTPSFTCLTRLVPRATLVLGEHGEARENSK